MNAYLKLLLTGSLVACTSHRGANETSQRFPEPSAAYHHAAEARKPEDPKLVWTPAHVALVASEVAPNVFAVYPDDAATKNAAGIPAATSGGFIVGTKGVLIVDTMINRNLAEQLLALVKERTDRPILYAVNTSFHGDHSYGNQFLPKGTQVIQHEATQKYIQTSFKNDIAFMSQYFGTSSGLEELTPQPAAILMKDGEQKDIDLGDISVTIENLGFAQTDGDLFVYVPSAKVLFTGNPILSGGPSFSWLLDGRSEQALATLLKLKTTFPPETVVVPGHGVPTGMAAVDAHIAYLTDLRTEVQAAIKDGLDAGKTSERVGERLQSRYGGYKIYGWVNTQLNVGKTFQEMSGAK
jgi:glyoxylase-like metal-dependent hydrolase (beta-lactamase superfamily II)